MAEDPQDAATGEPPAPAEPEAGARLAQPARRMVDPQRLIRIASVTREVLEEARRIPPEPGAVEHLRSVHDQIVRELREALPAELYEELDELTPDLRSGSLEELALAHAEILGWLEGLFQGTQIAIQLQAMRPAMPHPRPPGPGGDAEGPETGSREEDPRYL